MKYLVTGNEMKLLDQNTSEHFYVPSEILMEQAADGFVRELFLLKEEYNFAMNRVLVLCGCGNNGGDGVAISRLLNQKGICTDIFLCFDKEEGLLKKQLDIYRAYDYPIIDQLYFEPYDIVIDAVFGTGLSRNIDGAIKEILEMANECDAIRVAVDICSGISAEDGHLLGCAFDADFTITFSFEKIGHALYPGASYAGEIRIVPIGITMESSLDRNFRTLAIEEEDMDMLPDRIESSNKGTYGKLLIIAGSLNMAGAAYLAAKAAYRMGCGLVKIFTCEENRIILQTLIPEAILVTYNKSITENQVLEQLNWASAVLIGPGLGTDNTAEKIVEYTIKNITVPLVIDADALNIISKETDQLLKPHFDIVITPHIGEMSRLVHEPISFVQNHFVDTAREFADKYNVVCHLKDARSITVVPFGNQYIQLAGNDGMSTGGSGDVLSGIIASLIAQGMPYDLAAAFGAKIHGDCGDIAAYDFGRRAMMASDMIEALTQLAYLE